MSETAPGRTAKAVALAIFGAVMVAGGVYLYLASPARQGLRRITADGPARLSPFLDATGAPVAIEAFRGKLVVLNLWAQWCSPCLSEMPSLDRLADKLPADQYAIIPLTKDNPGDTVSQRAFTKLDLKHLKLYLDPTGRVAEEIGERGFPTTVILGPDGTPLLFREGETQWDSEEMIGFLRKLRASHSG